MNARTPGLDYYLGNGKLYDYNYCPLIDAVRVDRMCAMQSGSEALIFTEILELKVKTRMSVHPPTGFADGKHSINAA